MIKHILFVGVVVCCAAGFLMADHHEQSVKEVWEAEVSLQNGETASSTLTLEKKAGKWSGSYSDAQGKVRKFDRVSFEKGALAIEVDVEREGQSGVLGVQANLDAKGVLKGNWYVRGSDGVEYSSPQPWEAVRSLKAVLAGTWQAVAKTDEDNYRFRLVFSQSDSCFSGTAYNNEEEDSMDFSKVVVKGDKLSVEFDDDEAKIKLKASLRAAGKLMGEWSVVYPKPDEEESKSGEWTATKK